VFYCEHRKRVIPVCYEDIQMPWWMSMLIGTNIFEVSHVKKCICHLQLYMYQFLGWTWTEQTMTRAIWLLTA